MLKRYTVTETIRYEFDAPDDETARATYREGKSTRIRFGMHGLPIPEEPEPPKKPAGDAAPEPDSSAPAATHG